MKVTQVLYSGLGGHGSVAFSLQAAAAQKQASDAWRNSLIFLGIEPLLLDYQRLCAERGLERDYVGSTAGRPWRSWPGLYRALDAQRPEAIILHSVKAILPVWAYARRHGIPLVAVEHQANLLKKQSEWAVSRMIMQLADAVVVITPDYADALRAGLGRAWRPNKVHVIPNGIDTNAFAPVSRIDQSGVKVVGMASRFSTNKRHELLVEALRLLRERDGPRAWRLSLAGDGETRAAITGQAAKAGVSDMLDLPGFIGGDDLLSWFRGIDIYVHASDGETLSTSMLQAMSMGLPILGSDVTGINSLLKQGDGCGLLVKEKSPSAFARGLTRLAQHPELSKEIGSRARDFAVKHYSQEMMFNAYSRILECVCAKRSFT